MTRTLLTIGSITLLLLACGSGEAPATMDESAGMGKGEQLFMSNCTLCHGRDGKLGFNGAKDLTMSTLTKAEMIALVSNGKGLMMPYKNTLTAKEIEAVVQHVRSLNTAKKK